LISRLTLSWTPPYKYYRFTSPSQKKKKINKCKLYTLNEEEKKKKKKNKKSMKTKLTKTKREELIFIK
jgi:hypothetical protein